MQLAALINIVSEHFLSEEQEMQAHNYPCFNPTRVGKTTLLVQYIACRPISGLPTVNIRNFYFTLEHECRDTC